MRKGLRIGVDIQSLAGGRGPARYTTEIVKALSIVCNPDDVFYLYTPFDKCIPNLPENFVFRFLPSQKKRPWLSWTLPITVKRDRIDVMFFPANDFWLLRAAPTVVTLHDVAPGTTLFGFFVSWRDWLQNKLQVIVLDRIAHKVITVSRFSASSITSVIPGAGRKLVIIYNGVSEQFQRLKTEGTPVSSNILFVGGFDRRKNLEGLLQAHKLSLARGHKGKLVLVGSSGHNKKLYYDMPNLIKTYDLGDHVEIKSGVNDEELIQLYLRARLFVMPSFIEGFGLPVLEAMACGCPVVSSDAASLPEVGGGAVQYFDPHNIQEMADCMERVLTSENLRKEMIAKGFEQAKKFSWLTAGEQVYKVLIEAAIYRD